MPRGVVERALAEGMRVPGESVPGCSGDWRSIPAASEAILARAEVSAASPADLVPASDLAGVARLDAEPSPSIAGGNQRLAEALAAPLGRFASARHPGPIGLLGEDGSGCEPTTARSRRTHA